LSTEVLQGSVETCVNYGKIFIDYFTAQHDGKRILKIGYNFAELQAKIKWHLFSGHGVP